MLHCACAGRRSRLAAVLAACLAACLAAGARPADAASGSEGDAATWLATRWAATDLAALATAARAWRAEHGAWPADCASAAAVHLQPPPAADPWGRAYGCAFDDGRAVVFSLGPDGQPGTPDDVIVDVASGGPSSVPLPAGHLVAPSPGAGSAPGAEAMGTARAMRRIADALESHRRQEGHYPVTDRVEQLERWLVPTHAVAAGWSGQDGWGRPLRYRTTDIGSSYTLSSAGADGLWEARDPDGAGGVPPDGDLIIADGRFVRWPVGMPSEDAAPRTPAPAPPRDPVALTRERLVLLAARFAGHGSEGRHPESDDAERLAREMGGGTPAVDGWGRGLHYQSADGGRHFALVSAGADGRLAADPQAYARGAAPAGDDLVARDGRLLD